MPTFRGQVQNGQILLFATIMADGGGASLPALVDTGAQRTMISPKVVKEANLSPIGYTQIVPASGKPIRTEKYRANLGISIAQGNVGFVTGSELDVAGLPFQPENFDILLGMDLLRHFHFMMHGDLFILSN